MPASEVELRPDAGRPEPRGAPARRRRRPGARAAVARRHRPGRSGRAAADPWSGDLVDGEVWGRGAQDMKSQTAAEVAAALDLAESGWRPTHGDLLVIVVVDEENGGGEGAIWLTEPHPELVRCDFLLNEGGGTDYPAGDQRLYGVCTAEKGVFRFSLTTRGGPSTHAQRRRQRAAQARPAARRAGQPPARARHDQAPLGLLARSASPMSRRRAPSTRRWRLLRATAAVTFAPTIISAVQDQRHPEQRDPHRRLPCSPPGHARETRPSAARGDRPRRDGYAGHAVEEGRRHGRAGAFCVTDAITIWLDVDSRSADRADAGCPLTVTRARFADAFPSVWPTVPSPSARCLSARCAGSCTGKDERIKAADEGFGARAYKAIALELLARGGERGEPCP